MMLMFVALVWSVGGQRILSTADCANGQATGAAAEPNLVGLSNYLSQIIPQVNNRLFHKYILNSQLYGQWSSTFQLTIHTPVGYKFNCSLVEMLNQNKTINCTFDLSNNTFLIQLGEFCQSTTNFWGMTIGWDNQGANYSNCQYMEGSFLLFNQYLQNLAAQPFILETADKANEWASSGFQPNYTFAQPAQDCRAINYYDSYLFSSPGVTDTANSSWYDQIEAINQQCGVFTARGTVFPNVSALTIANLLSEDYTRQFIKNRFTVNGTDFTTKFGDYLVSFNQLRLVDDPEGVDGLTNSFAAAIWATELIMQWAIFDGFRVNFYNPIANASFQSVLGQSPEYGPSSLYYGLLTAVLANYEGPFIILPVVTTGTSSSVKVYGLDYFDYAGVLILNKDTDPDASGIVNVKLNVNSGVTCLYVSANNLSSTSNFSFGGFHWESNNSQPLGSFNRLWVGFNSSSGFYPIPLNYSQMVVCQTVVGSNFINFPTGRIWQGWRSLSVLLMFLILLQW